MKERAKWSQNSAEKKTAIRELSTHGDKALPALEEILSVTAYDEIKAACTEAIKAIKVKNAGATAQNQKKEDEESSAGATAQNQKKEDQESSAGAELKLADLPP